MTQDSQEGPVLCLGQARLRPLSAVRLTLAGRLEAAAQMFGAFGMVCTPCFLALFFQWLFSGPGGWSRLQALFWPEHPTWRRGLALAHLERGPLTVSSNSLDTRHDRRPWENKRSEAAIKKYLLQWSLWQDGSIEKSHAMVGVQLMSPVCLVTCVSTGCGSHPGVVNRGPLW